MPQILIVDDCVELRNWIVDVLAEEGFSTIVAGDGEAALRAFKVHKPDLALLDMVLPPPDGMELVRALRAMNPRLPIVAISGDLMGPDFLGLAKRWGACATLNKPFSATRLIEVVRAHTQPAPSNASAGN